MKLIKISALTSALVLVLTACGALTALAQFDRQGAAVIVFDGRDGLGNRAGFDEGTFLNNRNDFGALRNDSARSVRVARGYMVRFCDSEGNGNGTGRCEEFGEGLHNLRYADSASYVRVWRSGGGGFGNNDGGFGNGGVVGNGGFGTGAGVVTLYEDRDFRGRSQGFGIGTYRNDNGTFGNLRNDSASSIVVSRGYRARVCESEGDGYGAGRCDEYGPGSWNLRSNDSASLVQVQRTGGRWETGGGVLNGGGGRNGGFNGGGNFNAPVIVYEDPRQRGTEQTFDVGRYLNANGGLGALRNDSASSVYVSPGYRVRLCEDEGNGNGAGRCEEYGPGRYDLRYNDRASFIRVWRAR